MFHGEQEGADDFDTVLLKALVRGISYTLPLIIRVIECVCVGGEGEEMKTEEKRCAL